MIGFLKTSRTRCGRSAGPAARRLIVLLAVTTVAASSSAQAPTGDGDRVIGLVNQQPLHASTILDPLDDRLVELAGKGSWAVLRTNAKPLIMERIRQALVDRLLLEDARGALTPEERKLADEWSQEVRRRVVVENGAGDPATADRTLREQTGEGLEQHVAHARDRMLVQARLERLRREQVRITAPEIRAYYKRYRPEFDQPARRAIRLISTTDPAAADRVDEQLASGVPFREVAASEDNHLRRTQGGPEPVPVEGDEALVEPLNAAMVALRPGEHSTRLEYRGGFAWLSVEAIVPAISMGPDEAAPIIRERLEAQAYDRILAVHIRGLLGEARHTPIEEMVAATLAAARRRYLPERPGIGVPTNPNQ